MVIDTNVLILYAKEARDILKPLMALGESLTISRVTYIEFLAYKQFTPHESAEARRFMNEACTVIDLDETIAEHAVTFRLHTSLKLPDAIVAATAMALDQKLFTFDEQIRNECPYLVYEP